MGLEDALVVCDFYALFLSSDLYIFISIIRPYFYNHFYLQSANLRRFYLVLGYKSPFFTFCKREFSTLKILLSRHLPTQS